ncbi:dihydropteroate synthase [Parvularcula dongshanensis]|uniref:Dihydropteroate synthase n=1 Tax=Parvularcula dongshanensis TaxID=1173995 RepID=A0A840I6W8_9PROT|nr:dihydropteroate synthase [Parvularcula dongshanensis]MBB4659993.1 dihydropteroate synthase [Parvularcula dongshanensis]
MNLAPPILMGIVNATPDSFSDGGRFAGQAGVEHGTRLAEEGAQVLDVGGESTRPGAAFVPVQEEIDRVLPVIEGLKVRSDARISVDTRKPEVARAAVAAGASIWNDVSALTFGEDSLATAAALGMPVVLMHAQGDPATMQQEPRYGDVVGEVLTFLRARIEAARAAGVEQVIADPGIGFGKTLDHNLALFRSLERFQEFGVPLLMGASRKRFIASLDRDGAADERLGGSVAAVLRARAAGFGWFRVHDVAATRQALAVWEASNDAV